MITVDDLSGFPALTELTRDELAVLAQLGREVYYPGGHRLITEGRSADRCWLIRDGQVRIDSEVPGRGNVVLQTLGPGELLGWSWLVPPYRWHFGACTTEPVDTIEFDAAALTGYADTDPVFGRALTRTLFMSVLDRLQATRARLLDLYSNPADPPQHATGRPAVPVTGADRVR
ncbi:Crp/Fnr family transcriptional regulator [Nocardia sp. alder85J]|uniref:Crp/Fnr family transcriptional regulator n=1 Tax=Nocardia sp. alder85J TaxID=2862949 RepID=UPI001CD2DFC9|nr:cyclic nucleotide-binding domain-containing protein [Nocardia sp. alder85J]MCX4092464.1 cyclic nucleotide-binding domain-containing protein [Nocardia sp. alder85J]